MKNLKQKSLIYISIQNLQIVISLHLVCFNYP